MHYFNVCVVMCSSVGTGVPPRQRDPSPSPHHPLHHPSLSRMYLHAHSRLCLNGCG